jgi:DNA-binding MarR family transcriptional regulator
MSRFQQCRIGSMERDSVDEAMEEWAREWPELDRSAAGVINRIDRISGFFDRRFKATLVGQNLSYYGFKLLSHLRRSGPPYRLTPTDLSRRLLVSSGTLTNQIDQLEEAGLVARSPDPNDRRGVLVGLTAEGRRRVDAALVAHADDERRSLATLSADDQALLRDLLRKLLRSMEAEPDETAVPEPDLRN